MLDIRIKLHRTYLLADAPGQKLFMLLEILPKKTDASGRLPLCAAFVVDTSGSMRDPAAKAKTAHEVSKSYDYAKNNKIDYGKTKMEILEEALTGFVDSGLLYEKDRLSIIKFDDTAATVLPFTDVLNKENIKKAIGNLEKYSGGTNMGAGMSLAAGLFDKEKGNRRMFLLTDGNTLDEDLVREMSIKFTKKNIPITAIGIGDDWNADFISSVVGNTQGKIFHVLSGSTDTEHPSVRTDELSGLLLSELRHSINEVVSNIKLNISASKDIQIDNISKVYPILSEVNLSIKPFSLGNAEAGDSAIFLIELTVSRHNFGKTRLMQVSLTHDLPGADYRAETSINDIAVEFTSDGALVSETNQEVLHYVQQRSLESMISQAELEAKTNSDKAIEILKAAMRTVHILKNPSLNAVIEKAVGELNRTKTLSDGLLKTLTLGVKTKTVRFENETLTDEEIRNITG